MNGKQKERTITISSMHSNATGKRWCGDFDDWCTVRWGAMSENSSVRRATKALNLSVWKDWHDIHGSEVRWWWTDSIYSQSNQSDNGTTFDRACTTTTIDLRAHWIWITFRCVGGRCLIHPSNRPPFLSSDRARFCSVIPVIVYLVGSQRQRWNFVE